MPSQQGAKFHDFTTGARSKSTNPSGLALIERIYFGSGPKAAQEQLQHLLGPDQSLKPYALCDIGEPSSEADSISGSGAFALSYNPPISWNAAYSLQLVRFGIEEKDKDRDEYASHSGEELLVPIDGEVDYRFFWTPGGREPGSMIMRPSAAPGSILRINPQIPHRARGVSGQARAWVVMRHATNSPVALVMDQAAYSPFAKEVSELSVSTVAPSSARPSGRRLMTGKELRKAGVYAMVAWGISEAIRDARQKAGRTTTDLANQIGIDPSSLSRLEEAKANVSIEMLAKVCRSLRIGMSDCIDSGGWTHEHESINIKNVGKVEPMLSRPRGTHAIHPYALQLEKGQSTVAAARPGTDFDQISTWIVLRGRVLLEFPPNWGGKSAIIEVGSVIHFRGQGMLAVQALQDSMIVQVTHSHVCECKPREAENGVQLAGSRPLGARSSSKTSIS